MSFHLLFVLLRRLIVAGGIKAVAVLLDGRLGGAGEVPEKAA